VLDRLQQLVARQPQVPKELRRLSGAGRDAQEERLGRDVGVAHPLGLGVGDVEHGLELPRHRGLGAARHLAVRVDDLGGVALQRLFGDADVVRDPPDDPVLLDDHAREEVARPDLGVAELPCQLLGIGESFAGFDGELLELHGGAPASDGGRRVSRVGAGSRKRGRAYASDRGVDRMAPR
jgi:hypothetical protein